MAIPQVGLRPAGPRDEPFLRALFLDARRELAAVPLPPDQLAALVDGQLHAQRRAYLAHDRDARDEVIERATEPVGRCWTSADERELRLLDLAVRSDHRRRGVARAVLATLCARAASCGLPLRLSVWSENDAARQLYTSAGFTLDPSGADGHGYLQMTWSARPAITRRAS